MGASRWTDDEVGRGPLSRGSAAIYRVLVLEGLLLLTCAPTVVLLLLLGREVSNTPLAVLALVPVAPAVVAGLSAVRSWESEADLSPARPFWRAYAREVGPTLAWWVPAVVLLAILSTNLVGMDLVPGGAALRPATVIITVLVLVWAGCMAVLQARFAFRLRDAARVAVIEMIPQWRFSLGVAGLLLVLGTVTLLSSEIVTGLLAWAAVLLLHLMARPLVTDVTERFTRDD